MIAPGRATPHSPVGRKPPLEARIRRVRIGAFCRGACRIGTPTRAGCLDVAVSLGPLLLQTMLLGLAAAFTPSLLALQVLVCSSDPWRRRAAAVAVGGSSAFVLVGGLMLVGFAQLPTVSGVSSTVGIVLRLVVAVVLLGLAVWLFLPHPELSARMDRDITGYVSRASSWVFLGVAFALSIKDVSSFMVLAPGLHDIAVSPLDIVLQVLLVALLFVLALAPVLAPPAARLMLGHRADRAFARLYRFTMDHQFPLVGGMVLVVGAYLAISGVLLVLAD